MRAYELMIIADGDLEESDVSHLVNSTTKTVEDAGGSIASVDKWGKRRFAYEINKKTDGNYVVFEILAEGGALDPLERNLRLADNVVRHKLIRLPDHEATRRGLFGEVEATPAAADESADAEHDEEATSA